MLKLSFFTLASAVGLVISTSCSVRAMELNTSFEDNFNGWITIGQTSIETQDFGSSPTDGTKQAFLETLADTTGVSGSDLESFLGLSSGSLGGAIEGSAIKQTLNANAGDVLTFSANFLTNEPSNSSNNDLAFFTLGSLFPVADTNSDLLSSLTTPFDQETGYRTYTYAIPTAGTYTLGFGVADVGDRGVNSGLLVDNVSVTPVPFEFSPGLGVLLLGASWAIAHTKSRLLKFCIKAESKGH